MISKVAVDHPKSWTKYLGYDLWAYRESPHEVTGVPPWLMVFGRIPRGPLTVLKENWTGFRDLPLSTETVKNNDIFHDIIYELVRNHLRLVNRY